jgi:hypothetical protein
LSDGRRWCPLDARSGGTFAAGSGEQLVMRYGMRRDFLNTIDK